MNINIVTKEDLQLFKEELFQKIAELMQTKSGSLDKKWLKSVDVKSILNISSGTLQNLRINNTLNSKKVGGTHYYKSEDIEKLLEGYGRK